jgi:20S proteasome alpha/beta subunit
LFIFLSLNAISGAIQEVPYAAHGEGFSFVLGLLDRKNRENNELAPGTTSLEVNLHEGTDMNGESPVISRNGDISELELLESSSQLSLTKNELTLRRGKLLQMTVNEGVKAVRACMEAARKRTSGSLGSCRIKGVFSSGCKNLGQA